MNIISKKYLCGTCIILTFVRILKYNMKNLVSFLSLFVALLLSAGQGRAQAPVTTSQSSVTVQLSAPVASDSLTLSSGSLPPVDPAVADSLAKLAAQEEALYWAVADSIARTIPDELTHDLDKFAGYINQNLSSPQDRIRAIYEWMIHNVKYDAYGRGHSRNEVLSENEDATITLDKREGQCLEYSILFRQLCKRCGIPVEYVYGYNRQNGVVQPYSHQWCSACIDNHWYLFDTTWGAGSLDANGVTYIPAPNDKYFMIAPDELLKTHMPFDPMWQLKETPITYQEFESGQRDLFRLAPAFAWQDTLDNYLHMDSLHRFESVKYRMEHFKPTHKLVLKHLHETVEGFIDVFHQNEMIAIYNRAVILQGKAVDSLNVYIRYLNAEYQPLKSDAEIRRMIEIPEVLFNQADSLINSIRVVRKDFHLRIQNLRTFIMDYLVLTRKHKMFVDQYLATPPKRRKDFF